MSPTLFDKIREAVYRDPAALPVTRNVGPVEVFNTYGDSEEGHDSASPAVAEAPAVVEEAVLEKAEAKLPHRHFGGAQTVARPGSQDGERINALQTQVTALQAVVAKDQAQANDCAHFGRFANDAIRVHSGLVK